VTRQLPTGTVTFLFTDIEGSTKLLERLGDHYADALAEHRRLLRRSFERQGGVEVDTQGDAFFVTFPSARGAAIAAADAQRSLAETDVRVRVGLHSGEASSSPDGYVGVDVHRASRICSAAHGGQVVLSQATRELVEGALPDDLELRDLGEHRLKDLMRPQRLYQLVVGGVETDFPPLRTLELRPTNLPVQQAPLIGRERELREVRELLAGTRLLTLTGAGGAGKTRLALQLAADVADGFDDGVFFVDLADIADPELVVPAIAHVLGIRERAGLDIEAAVSGHLAPKRTLLVLDNVEHVMDAAPRVARLVAVASDLKLLATSRVPLHLTGEQEYPVPPLSVDAAVELFADRARAVRPGFVLDGDRAAVAEICARLDALPLAIELAAARVKLLPPPKLLERLEQRLPVLTAGSRDAPARHRTLRATIDWSFDLLDPGEQELFAQLSVFAGGFTLEAAEEICDATIDDLASLVDKSLVVHHDPEADEPRFVLLETVREYAREQLDDRGRTSALAERHARFFRAAVERAATLVRETDLDAGREFLSELDNLRSVQARLAAAAEAEDELRFATAAFWCLWTRASLRELKAWLEAALERGFGLDDGLRADALGAAALAAFNLGESELAREYARRSLALARERDDKRQTEWALRVLAFDEPDLAERRRLLHKCERLLTELGYESGLGWVTYLLGIASLEEGDFADAQPLFGRAVEIFRRLGRRWEATNAELGLAHALLAAGRPQEAVPIADRALVTALEVDSTTLAAEAMVLVGSVRVEDDPGAVARLVRAVEAIADAEGHPLDRHFAQPLAVATLEKARQRLAEQFEAEAEAASRLTLDEAIELARSLL